MSDHSDSWLPKYPKSFIGVTTELFFSSWAELVLLRLRAAEA